MGLLGDFAKGFVIMTVVFWILAIIQFIYIKQIANARLDETLVDGKVRYVKLATVQPHPTHEGKYTYGRIQIETETDLIGKEVAIIILVPTTTEEQMKNSY